MTVGNPWINEIARVNSVINQTIRNIERDRALLAANPNGPDAPTLRQQIESGEAFLADKRAELQIFQTEYQAFGRDSTASSGQVILEEKTSPSNPAAPASVLAPSGRINPENVETGTNAPVRSQVQTQATPPAGDGAPLPYQPDLVGESYAVPGVVTTQAGAAANRDDNTRPNSNSTAQIINASFNQRIVPRKNVLDEYASYTYAITWYLLTPDQYNEMVRSKKKNCASWQLLMQSGGAPTVAADATATASSPAGRNKFFDLDYYIDDLEIESMIPLKGTGAANTATNIRFKVTEPSGITLIENLSNAVKTLYKERNVDKNANYPMAQYCLVVRFYGYNENGELITTGRRGTNGQTNLTDPRAIVEKFYPFVITNIKFRIPRASVVEYQVDAKPIPHFYNKSQDRGSIPFAFELAGTTVEQILQGKPVGTVYPASAGERRDSPQPNTSAPTQPAEPTSGAGVDVNGNFTGDITPGSISSVLGA
jgi:hypothetical protein